MLKGQLWATSQMEMVNQALVNGFKVIYLGDPISIDPMYKDKFVIASSLVPDYQTMSMKIDGNEDGFIQMYVASLNSRAAVEMLTVIFAALYNGVNVMFYVPQEALGIGYEKYLLQFICNNYGIQTQTSTLPFAFDMNFAGRVIEMLYLYNLVSAQEFLINSSSLDQMSIRKLIDELHPMVQDPNDINQIMEWFRNYKESLISTGKPLINGVQYADEVRYGCF